jgi:V/A-type H+-transporting ATPase subunit K
MESALTALAAAIAIGVAALATAWAQSRIGPAAAAALAEKRELAGTSLIMLAIPETILILGFVIAFMILRR